MPEILQHIRPEGSSITADIMIALRGLISDVVGIAPGPHLGCYRTAALVCLHGYLGVHGLHGYLGVHGASRRVFQGQWYYYST